MRASSLLAVLLLTPLRAQDTSKLPQQPVKDWKYQRKEVNPKTGVEEVTMILDGKEAVPLTLTPGKEVFDIRGIHARYFTDPRNPGEPSREIDVWADRGQMDNGARTLKLQDHVVVVKKGDPDQNEIDTILRAVSAVLHFTKKYECPECRMVLSDPGRCPDHGQALKETTVTSIEADREFDLAGSEGILSGVGLFTDDAIKKEYHITKNGFVEFSQVPALLSKDPGTPAIPESKFTQIFSRGPLHIAGPENLRKIQGRGGMRIDRIDSTGTFTTEAREMTISMTRRIDPSTGEQGPTEINGVDAHGEVMLEGVTFSDGASFHARSDTLVRTHAFLEGQKEIDLLTLTQTGAVPVILRTGASTIDSRKVIINRINGKSDFEDVVRSDLVAGAQRFALSCGKLTTLAEEGASGGRALRSIDAEDRVHLGGLMSASGGDPGQAEADRFLWDVEKKRGQLEATSFVRITQGPSTIVAPLILLESPNIIVLKGPKQVHFIQETGKKKEEYRATCASDLVLDQSSHRLWMRDACVIRTEELLLHSDQVDGQLSPDGKGLTSLLAQGHVCALHTSDHTTLYGSRLTFRFADQDLRVYGSPYAVADAGRTRATQEEIRVFEKVNPRTGKNVRYTEMIGGSDGVQIEIDERTTASPPGEPKK